MVDASRKVVKQMVVDLGSSNPARFQDAQLTRSNKNWGVFVLASPVPANCMAYDGYSIVHKKNGKWTNVTGGSSYPCSLFTETLRRNGAPTSVIKDFKSYYNTGLTICYNHSAYEAIITQNNKICCKIQVRQRD